MAALVEENSVVMEGDFNFVQFASFELGIMRMCHLFKDGLIKP